MKLSMLAGAITSVIGTVCFADGSSAIATGECEIGIRNPVAIGHIWLEDGPYGSLTKLTRSTTRRLFKGRPSCRLTRA